MNSGGTHASAYWGESFQVSDQDIEHLINLLIEGETPLSTEEMARALVERRLRLETERRQREEKTSARLYLPQDTYQVGEEVTFPGLEYAVGTVQAVRPGRNPDIGSFEVLQVEFGPGRRREFAAGLSDHRLNAPPELGMNGGAGEQTPEEILHEHGSAVVARLGARLQKSADLVRIAGRWFPSALLVKIHAGHLNLAEAALDVAGGGPLPTSDLLTHLDLPQDINSKLLSFSVDYSLQEDERFDEVGPAGQVLWHLRRLEPEAVVHPPERLVYTPVPHDERVLTPELRKLEGELDDEASPERGAAPAEAQDEVVVVLTYPHFRQGTLPLSSKLASLFPTAYEAPRIRFILVDGLTGEKFPGWVVRTHRFVSGLADWYKKHDVVAGAYVAVRSGEQPGEVIVQAQHRRPISEWVRTATASEPRGLTFSLKRRPVRVNYDEHMMVIVEDIAAVDAAWWKTAERNAPLPQLVAGLFRELAKLNPQSAVHARALYSAVNVIRRCPPGPIFAELGARPYYVHVGDLYWRFDESRWGA